MKVLNIMQTDIEQSCLTCDTPTRLVLIEPTANYPLCFDCVLTLAAVEVISENMLDRIDRHINN